MPEYETKVSREEKPAPEPVKPVFPPIVESAAPGSGSPEKETDGTNVAKTLLYGIIFVIFLVVAFSVGFAVVFMGSSENTPSPSPTPATTDNKVAVTITSVPTGASVYMAGEYKGTTPLTLKLTRFTSYMIVLKKTGYSQWAQSVSVRSEPLIVNANMASGSSYYSTPYPTSIPQQTQTKIAASSDKTKAKAISQAIQPTNSAVRAYALRAIQRTSDGTYNVDQICDIYNKLYSDWIYVNDPSGSDYYAPASESVSLLRGDCDDYAILMASLVEAIGGSARVILAYDEAGNGHAYSELFLTNSKVDAEDLVKSISGKYGGKTVYYHISSNPTEYWLNLDWSANHPGGKFYDSTGTILIIRSNGNYVRSYFTP